MIVEAKKMIEQVVNIEVDDRIHQEDTVFWHMADMILEGKLDNIIDRDLYCGEFDRVSYAAKRINEAFQKADKALALIKEGKFEI